MRDIITVQKTRKIMHLPGALEMKGHHDIGGLHDEESACSPRPQQEFSMPWFNLTPLRGAPSPRGEKLAVR